MTYSVEIRFAGGEMVEYFIDASNGESAMLLVLYRYHLLLKKETLIRLEVRLVQ